MPTENKTTPPDLLKGTKTEEELKEIADKILTAQAKGDTKTLASVKKRFSGKPAFANFTNGKLKD